MLDIFLYSLIPFILFWAIFLCLENVLIRPDKKEEIIRTHYIVKSKKILAIVFIIGMLFSGGCVVFGALNNETLWVITLFVFFFVVSAVGGLNIAVWKIDVNGEEIIWRSTFGRETKFRFEDITKCVVKTSGTIKVYVHGKRLFTIDNNINAKEFMSDIKRRGIFVKYMEIRRYDLEKTKRK